MGWVDQHHDRLMYWLEFQAFFTILPSLMSITTDFIRKEIKEQSYEISLHADDERIADELTVSQLELVLLNCEVIEEYPDDHRGERGLAAGFLDKTPVHIVCGKNLSRHLILITVYIATMPKWKEPYMRNR